MDIVNSMMTTQREPPVLAMSSVSRYSNLPSYVEEEGLCVVPDTRPEGVENLGSPAPEASGHGTEHRYAKSKGRRPWLTLIIQSRASRAEDLPYFFGHTPITGRVELDLAKPQCITKITLQVRTLYNHISKRNMKCEDSCTDKHQIPP
jgi:hypothetical protein